MDRMAAESEHLLVLAAYPDDCQPIRVESLGGAGGFSGARFWRVEAARGTLCLRRWPREYPPREQLEFIQAVLLHVAREGFGLVPVPRETGAGRGFVSHRGYFWELSPWMPGVADFADHPTEGKLRAAMRALAELHLAAATFPLPQRGSRAPSPGIGERLVRLRRWLDGGLDELAAAMRTDTQHELGPLLREIVRLGRPSAGKVLATLERASRRTGLIQPCVRDVWCDHLLFDGEEVTGLVDFGSMQPDNVAADVARLLGSLAGDDADGWQSGLEAYQAERPLSNDERELVVAFDRSTVLMSGWNWAEWIYLQGRSFDDYKTIAARLNGILERLARLLSV